MIVIDTSVAIKWLRTAEEKRESALALYANHLGDKEKIVIPSLFYIEAANALATNNILSFQDISEGMKFLFDADLNEYIVTQENIIEAAILAKQHRTSVYDMLYAVIAKAKNTILITADERFVKSVNLPYVKSLTG